MKHNLKISYIFLLITVILLCSSIVSAHETQNNTDTITTEQVTQSQTIKDTNTVTIENEKTNNKEINKKTENTQTKTANKKPVNFDIIIRNNIADNSTIEIGVIDSNAQKAIPDSNITLNLPDKTKINTKTLKTGYVNVTMKLPATKNTVHIDYKGTDNYYPYDYDLELNVIKRNANMQINAEKSNNTGDVKLTLKITDSTNNNPITNAKTTIKISDGRTLNANTNNKAEATYNFKLNSGKNNINITYPGDDKYNPIKTNLTIDMGKIKNNVDYDVVLNNLYVGQTSISVTLKDYVTRKTIPDTQLTLKLSNGKQYTGKTDKNGVLTKNIDAPVGKNYMNITYNGNTTYNKKISTINFTVTKRITNINVTINDNTNPKLDITLKDMVLNKTINNAPITITYDNNKITKTTNNKGQVTLPITVPAGSKKTYKVTYNGNTNLTNSSNTLTVTKEKPKIPVTYNITVLNKMYKNDTVIFRLIDTQTGKTIPQETISIKLPQKTITAKTNNKGEISLQTNMTPGSNNITLTYNGNNKYANNTSPAKISIDKRPSVINASIKVTDILKIQATLQDSITKTPIAMQKIILIHPKQNITLTTDNKGKIDEDVILPAGKASIRLVYNGNNYYKQSAVNPTNITLSPISKVATKITLNPVTAYMGDKVTITAKINDIRGNTINMGEVVFKLNGNTLKTDNIFGSKAPSQKIKVKNGVASITLTADKVLRNSNNLTVTYSGNDKYYKNTSNIVTPTIHMKKAVVTVTATPKIQQQYQKITITVKVADVTNNKNNALTNHEDSYVFLKINGKTLVDSKNNKIQVKVVNQTATYVYQIPQAAAGINKNKTVKDHIITAVYVNPYYSVARNTTSFRVNRSATHFDISKTEYNTKTRTLTITGNIKDYKNINVLGNTLVNIKINGKTLPFSDKTTNYQIVDGKISLKLTIPSTINKIRTLTLKCGNRLAYTQSTYETSTIILV